MHRLSLREISGSSHTVGIDRCIGGIFEPVVATREDLRLSWSHASQQCVFAPCGIVLDFRTRDRDLAALRSLLYGTTILVIACSSPARASHAGDFSLGAIGTEMCTHGRSS